MDVESLNGEDRRTPEDKPFTDPPILDFGRYQGSDGSSSSSEDEEGRNRGGRRKSAASPPKKRMQISTNLGNFDDGEDDLGEGSGLLGVDDRDWGAESLDGGEKMARLLKLQKFGAANDPGRRGVSAFRARSRSVFDVSNRRSSHVDWQAKAAAHVVTEEEREAAQMKTWDTTFCCCFDKPFGYIPTALRHRALCGVHGGNRLRLFTYNIVTSRAFEALVIAIILANCVLLAMDDPNEPREEKPAWTFWVDLGFAIFYTLEMLLKIFALGLVRHRGSYFQDAWNRLDALIVVATWMAFVPGFGNYSGLRVLRVLRPLRSMNAIKGLKILVIALLKSFESLWPVMLLAMIIIAIFGIVGSQLWARRLTNVCVPIIANRTAPNVVAHDPLAFYYEVSREESSLFTYRCRPDAEDYYGEFLGAKCPDAHRCLPNQGNPGLGFVSWDHAGWAILTVFQVVTFESWPAVLRATEEVSGPFVFVYFFFLILIGAYFVPNLAVAIINERYHSAIRKEKERDEALREEIEKEKNEQARQKRTISELKEKLSSGRLKRHQSTEMTPLAVGPKASSGGIGRNRTISFAMNDTVTSADHTHESDESAHEPVGPSCWLSFRNLLFRFTQGCPLPEHSIAVAQATNTSTLTVEELYSADDDEAYEAIADGDDAPTIKRKRRENRQRKQHRRSMTVFTAFILLCIVLNTIVLAAQHHNQPAWMDEYTEWANLGFLCAFALELILVLVAVGFTRFFQSGFFVLDLIVVAASIVELFIVGSGFLTVFRALRLLRPLKLVRNAPSLQAIVHVMIDAVRDTVYVNLVLLLTILIFALAGMQFFGAEMNTIEADVGAGTPGQPAVTVRATFTTFLRSFYTVFQVITTDNWTDVMWSAMYATGPAAAVYFVVLVLVGYYVVVNLFLSILITGFEREAEKTHYEGDGEASDSDVDDADAAKQGGNDDDDDDDDLVNDMAKSTRKAVDATQRAIKAKLAADFAARRRDEEGDADVTVLVSNKREARERAADDRREKLRPIVDRLFQSFNTVPETALALALEVEREQIEKALQPMATTNWACSRCSYKKQRALPAPPFVPMPSVHELHDAQCHAARRRHVREQFLMHLLGIVHEAMSGNTLIQSATVREILENAQEAECFMRLTADDLSSWRDIRDEAREELDVVRLCTGEEQLGRAHISYVYRGIKIRAATNGSSSMFVFGPENAFRGWLYAVTNHSAFNGVMLLFIAASTLLLIYDNPRAEHDEQTRTILFWIDMGITGVFAVEILMRVVALGLFMHPGSYLRSGWHWLDVISVGVTFASEVASMRALRALRFLRPLRSIKRYRGLRLVVSTILQSVKGITHVALLSLIGYLIFGVLAVQFFGGMLYECTDPSVTSIYECHGTFAVTANVLSSDKTEYVPTRFDVQRKWQPSARNFDHIGSSVLTLFQVSTGDDWADVMYSAMDAKSTTEAPERDHQPLYGLFFVVFYMVMNFFFVNLFVGVVIVNFSQVKQKIDGLAFLTPEQRLWVDSQRAILRMRPEPMLLHPNAGAFRRSLDAFVRSKAFELFIAACIAINVIAIGMEYDGQDKTYGEILEFVSWGFAGLFFVEMLLKWAAHGQRYFYLGWNRFDCFLALIGVATASLEIAATFKEQESLQYVPFNLTLLRVLRFVRVLRVLRLFQKARRVRVLIETLWHSLPSIGNISLLLMIIYIVFAVIGMQLFGNVKSGGRFIDDETFNFHTFASSVQLLFIFTTNEKWSDAMYDLSEGSPYCREKEDDCGVLYAPAYFVCFMIISAFVVSNLFLAIILDNFAMMMKLDYSAVTLSDLHRFLDVWAMYDPDGTHCIDTGDLPHLLAALQPPLGTTRASSRLELLTLQSQYQILDRSGKAHFSEIIVPLTRQAMAAAGKSLAGFDIGTMGFDRELDELPPVWFGGHPAHTGHTYAATYIAACYRRHKQRQWFQDNRKPRPPRKQRRSIAMVMDFED